MMDDNQYASREWPIAPTFLSLRQGCTEDTAHYNTDGIYYTDYLRGFLADLSHDKEVQNALALFQFVPKDYLPNDPNAEDSKEITTAPNKATVILNEPLEPKIKEILNRQGKKIIRIDSGTFVNNGELCAVFRKLKLAHTSYCFMQDSIVGIFADEKLNNCLPNSEEYRDRLEEIIKELNKGRKEISKIKCESFPKSGKTKRLYVHYTCPYSLFEEHFFPIYIQGHIIACLMFGQVGRDPFNRERSFEDYFDKMKKMAPRCPNMLLDIKSVNIDQWGKKADTIVDRIEIFEKRLEGRIDHRNTRYIHREFEIIEKMFRKDVKGINIKKQDAVSEFTKALSEAFTSIRKKFDNSEDGFIRMFALPIDIKHEELVPIGWSGAEFDAKDDFRFALSLLKDIDTLSDEETEKRVKEAASNRIKEKYDKEKGDIFLAGRLAGKEVAYIVWKRHDKDLKKNKITFEPYKQALRNFYSVALECYSYIRGTKMELLLETTIQESTHESAHFILPALDAVEKHLSAIAKENVKPEFDYIKYIDTYNRYKDEVLESLNQLAGINSGDSLIFSEKLEIKKEPVEVFYLLYKLKRLFSNRAKNSHKTIWYEQEKHYVMANIDVPLFNHALYNLLDNAIKYGHEGSYIYMNMNIVSNNIIKVRITSYGIGIPKNEEDSVYKLFERGIEASTITRGTGLGMYLVRKICTAFGGTVSHKSEFLSKYNIPVLFNFEKNNKLGKDFSLDEKTSMQNEISWLSGSIQCEVVCDYAFVNSRSMFNNRINRPTYRNTFIITIPLQ